MLLWILVECKEILLVCVLCGCTSESHVLTYQTPENVEVLRMAETEKSVI